MGEDEFALMQELMQILDEETTVATKTKLNSDYVPGMQIFRSNLGDPFVTVRGLPFRSTQAISKFW